ncbi:siderophore ABC transporter substrate-binding protein [Paenibacillus aceris]|uniref:Iron complex transport system substrate-binding protein n=1 Tax=Paenibacillus aceris TaxID=869555 RepID=A0ABS4I6G2_9BACL|nr:siderophore ABC transporter substrate-binding protein [Paenibacillus aceris]MBP1966116.1 iron complex transport system substrate-binding protein [Paenibacillus aceris]NHW39659.1 siderophore ABC transporter substrate-binding protein [Paenibacillus aceris]
MSRKIVVLISAVMIAIFAAACGNGSGAGTETAKPAAASPQATAAATAAVPAEITVKHKLGETKVKTNPKKVFVFDYGVLDSLDRLGVEVTGVPQASLPSYLGKFKDSKYINGGTLFEPDFEKINASKADLIIISGRAEKAYAELSKIAPTIFMGVDNTKYMESFKENVVTLGKIFGKEAKAEEEIAKIDGAAKQLQAKASATGKNALIVLVQDTALSAYGAGSRFGIIHDVFGFKQADSKIEVSTHGQNISNEYILEKNPDYLFVVDRGKVVDGKSTGKQIIENELVKKTNAFKNGNIIYLDANYWYLSGGGLISVEGMVKQVADSVK